MLVCLFGLLFGGKKKQEFELIKAGAFGLCEGGELLDRILSRGGKYTEDDAKAVMIQILNVVAFCHLQAVVHRDLKPEVLLHLSILILLSVSSRVLRRKKMIDYMICSKRIFPRGTGEN